MGKTQQNRSSGLSVTCRCGWSGEVEVERKTGWWRCPGCETSQCYRLGDPRIPPPRRLTALEGKPYREEYQRLLREMRERGHDDMAQVVESMKVAHDKARDQLGRDVDDRYGEESAESRACRLMIAAGVPTTVAKGFLTGTWIRSPACVSVGESVREGAQVVIISGATGEGKTIGMASLMWIWCLREARRGAEKPVVVFVRARELAEASWFGDAAQAQRDRILRAQLLGIDELGQEHADSKDHWRGELERILDVRCGENRPTYITTNLDRGAIEKRYGERAWRRMAHGKHFLTPGDWLGGGE